jgi:putative DNA methylase
MAIEATPAVADGAIYNINAPKNSYPVRPVTISTDPPYYDNIGYADLSDFFYVWLRRALGERDGRDGIWPDLFRRLLTPKTEELVATPHHHGGKAEAERFFLEGMSKALTAMHNAASPATPLAIYYAFKQSEAASDGVTSAGWASFLQAVTDAGLAIDGTWPLRTELSNRMIGIGANALASSIVLVCRKRDGSARAIERDEFKRALRRELAAALTNIRSAGVGPVDMAQAAIGPGMGIFTGFSTVLESSGEPMLVKDALKLINEVRDEIDDEGEYDLETRFAVEWFTEAQWDSKESGRAILLANAKNLAESQLERAGVIEAKSGKTRLRTRAEIGEKYDPADDKTPTVWEHAQALAYGLEQGGQERAAVLFSKLRDTESVRALAYRLYGICERKGWSGEALIWNRLAEEWRRIEDLAAAAPKPVSGAAPDLFGENP